MATGSGGGVTVDNASGSLPTLSLGAAGSEPLMTMDGEYQGAYSIPFSLSAPPRQGVHRDLDGASIRVYAPPSTRRQAGGQDVPGWCSPTATCRPTCRRRTSSGSWAAPHGEPPDGPVGGGLGAIGVAEESRIGS